MTQTMPELHPGKRVGTLDNLRPIMERHGMQTNQELATLTNVKLNAIKDLTSCRRGASYEMALQIARRLGVTIPELTGRPLGILNDDAEDEEPDDVQTLTVDRNYPGIHVREVSRPTDLTPLSPDPVDLSLLMDSLDSIESNVQTIVDELEELRAEHKEMKAAVDRIDHSAQNPPKRGFFR